MEREKQRQVVDESDMFDFPDRECDIPRTAEINKYMAMSKDERERLIAEEMERLRKQWALDDEKSKSKRHEEEHNGEGD